MSQLKLYKNPKWQIPSSYLLRLVNKNLNPISSNSPECQWPAGQTSWIVVYHQIEQAFSKMQKQSIEKKAQQTLDCIIKMTLDDVGTFLANKKNNGKQINNAYL